MEVPAPFIQASGVGVFGADAEPQPIGPVFPGPLLDNSEQSRTEAEVTALGHDEEVLQLCVSVATLPVEKRMTDGFGRLARRSSRDRPPASCIVSRSMCLERGLWPR